MAKSTNDTAQTLTIAAGAKLSGEVRVDGDKSLSHRSVLFAAMASGQSVISGFLHGGDCEATVGVARALGVPIERVADDVVAIDGHGLAGLCAPTAPLDCANSGTTMRLVAGLLAGRHFTSELRGTAQLQGRPMGRIVGPLRRLGAKIRGRELLGRTLAPLQIEPGELLGGHFDLPVASAQVASCLTLAALQATGPSTIAIPGPARDHTQRLLAAMGAPVEADGTRRVRVGRLTEPLQPLELTVPGDPSSAAFIAAAAAMCATEAGVVIRDVAVNPTRTGFVDVLRAMGASIELRNLRHRAGEPVADLEIAARPLTATRIDGELVVRAIDELPVLAVVATQATGVTVIADAAELRVKETDRIATIVARLRAMGAQIEMTFDGMLIYGPTPLKGCELTGARDHRIAMAMAVAGLVAESGTTKVTGAEVIADSFPSFQSVLRALGAAAHFGDAPPAPSPRAAESPLAEGERVLVGVIGWPVEQSRSPRLHRAGLAAQGRRGDSVHLAVEPERIAAAVGGLVALGFRGASVTAPHKRAALELADRVDESALALGVSNCLVVEGGEVVAYNTDAAGFAATLPSLERFDRAVVLGAGGAARAVLWALKGKRENLPIELYNRSRTRAEELLEDLDLSGEIVEYAALAERLSGARGPVLVVDATPLGWDGVAAWPGRLPLRDDDLAYDLVYGRPTALSAAALAAGARYSDGSAMLAEQARVALELWLDEPLTRAAVAALREATSAPAP